MTPPPTPFRLDPPLTVIAAAVLLFAFALWLRLIGTGWDGWAALHPDERHMVFVVRDMLDALNTAPAMGPLSLWFDPASPLNPRGTGRMHVYGELPVLAVTLFCRLTGVADWAGITQAGRLMTAAVDASSVLAVFVLAQMTLRHAPPSRRHATALFAATLYACAPTPLQLANFFTVDAWLSALSLWALVPMLALAQGSRTPLRSALLAGMLSGLALACKLPALALGVPGLLAIGLLARHHPPRTATLALALAVASAALTFRLTNPFAFAGPGLLGLGLSPAFLSDFTKAQALAAHPDMPPNWQWLAGYPIWALARDLALFGLGPAITLGAVLALRPRARHPAHGPALMLLASAALAHTVLTLALGPWVLRYFAPLVGIAAIAAALGLTSLPRPITAPITALTAALALFWAAGSVALHSGAHPRLIASDWMRRIPPGTPVAFETDWDESLPVLRHSLPGMTQTAGPAPFTPGPFTPIPLRLTDAETPDTPARLAKALDRAEYLTLSSGRQVEVLPRLPDRFPTATRYYAALADGRLCFERVFYADRGFPLPLIPFDDSFAQEPWRVYDHPIVSIWQKQPCFDPARAAEILSGQD